MLLLCLKPYPAYSKCSAEGMMLMMVSPVQDGRSCCLSRCFLSLEMQCSLLADTGQEDSGTLQRGKPSELPCSFPGAAVSKRCRLGDSELQKFTVLEFWQPAVHSQGRGRAGSSWTQRETCTSLQPWLCLPGHVAVLFRCTWLHVIFPLCICCCPRF